MLLSDCGFYVAIYFAATDSNDYFRLSQSEAEIIYDDRLSYGRFEVCRTLSHVYEWKQRKDMY